MGISMTNAKNILNAQFNTSNKTASNNTVSFAATPYLALLTKMPNADGTGYEEPTSSEYARVLLTNKGAYGSQMMGAAVTEDGTGTHEGELVAAISNQDLITFPVARTEGFGTIVGFAVFPGKTSTVPDVWGKLGYTDVDDKGNTVFVEEPVEIVKKGVPMFIQNDFKMILA